MWNCWVYTAHRGFVRQSTPPMRTNINSPVCVYHWLTFPEGPYLCVLRQTLHWALNALYLEQLWSKPFIILHLLSQHIIITSPKWCCGHRLDIHACWCYPHLLLHKEDKIKMLSTANRFLWHYFSLLLLNHFTCLTLSDPIDGSPPGSPPAHHATLSTTLRPWDSPSKNTGVGCHFLLQCMKVKSESEVAQSCPTFCDPMDYSLPGSSVHGIFQARVLEWGAIAFSYYFSLASLKYTGLLRSPCQRLSMSFVLKSLIFAQVAHLTQIAN